MTRRAKKCRHAPAKMIPLCGLKEACDLLRSEILLPPILEPCDTPISFLEARTDAEVLLEIRLCMASRLAGDFAQVPFFDCSEYPDEVAGAVRKTGEWYKGVARDLLQSVERIREWKKKGVPAEALIDACSFGSLMSNLPELRNRILGVTMEHARKAPLLAKSKQSRERANLVCEKFDERRAQKPKEALTVAYKRVAEMFLKSDGKTPITTRTVKRYLSARSNVVSPSIESGEPVPPSSSVASN